MRPREIERDFELLTETQVCRMLAIHRSTLSRWIKDGIFPKPFKLRPRCNRWFRDGVNAFMDRNSQKYGNSVQREVRNLLNSAARVGKRRLSA